MNFLSSERSAVQYLSKMDLDNCQALFMPVGRVGDQEKKSFSYFGVPNGKGPFPAIILVHGGGGTAYTEWVKRWVDHGYAALAIDIEGAATCYKQKEYHNMGLIRKGNFEDFDLPKEEQWMYQVIQAVMQAKTFLENYPCIKKESIGIMGISWGGLAAANVISYYPQFCFGIAVYGCGCCEDDPAYFGRIFRNNPDACFLWNPLQRMKKVQTPLLWINGDNDDFFSVLSTSKCYEISPNSNLAIIPGFLHGHEPAWELETSYLFADSICNGGKCFPKIYIEALENTEKKIQVRIEGPELEAYGTIQIMVSLKYFSYDLNGHGCTPWKVSQSSICTQKKFEVLLNKDAKLVYVNLQEENGTIHSSNVIVFK